MSDVEREARRIGGRIWPDPAGIVDRLNPGPAPRSRRGLVLGLVTAGALGGLLLTALAFRSTGSGGPAAAGAVASSLSSSSSTSSVPGLTTPAPPSAAVGVLTPSGTGTATATVVVPPPSAAPATPGPASTPGPTSAPQPGAVTLIDASTGRAITVRVGTTVAVSLSASAAYRWTQPSTSNPAAVRLTGGTANADGSADAGFVAAAPGQADLTAVDNPACYPRCLPPSRLWRVTVTVVP